MSRTLRLLLAPVTSGLTYRRFVHLLLGAVLLLPYLGLVALFVAAVNAGDLRPLDLLLLLVPATAMAVGVALVPGVRALEITAARALLGAVVPDPDPATLDAWPGRRRAAGWLLVNLAAGGLTALASTARWSSISAEGTRTFTRRSNGSSIGWAVSNERRRRISIV